jgi:hypothetical protein
MKRSKSKKPKKKKKRPRPHKPLPQSKRLTLRKNLRVFLAAGALLSLIEGVFAFLPTISVSTATTLGQTSSSYSQSIPFVVSNDGPVSVHSVEYRCFVRKAEFTRRHNLQNELLHDQRLDKRILRSKEKDNVPCIPLYGSDPVADLISADVELRVSFRPSFLFWRQENRFRFETYRSHRGELHWLPKPID